MRGLPYTKQEDEQLYELAKAGYSSVEIARMVPHRTASCIRNRLRRRYGVRFVAKHKIRIEVRSLVLGLLERGHTIPSIARFRKVQAVSVRRIVLDLEAAGLIKRVKASRPLPGGGGSGILWAPTFKWLGPSGKAEGEERIPHKMRKEIGNARRSNALKQRLRPPQGRRRATDHAGQPAAQQPAGRDPRDRSGVGSPCPVPSRPDGAVPCALV